MERSLRWTFKGWKQQSMEKWFSFHPNPHCLNTAAFQVYKTWNKAPLVTHRDPVSASNWFEPTCHYRTKRMPTHWKYLSPLYFFNFSFVNFYANYHIINKTRSHWQWLFLIFPFDWSKNLPVAVQSCSLLSVWMVSISSFYATTRQWRLCFLLQGKYLQGVKACGMCELEENPVS